MAGNTTVKVNFKVILLSFFISSGALATVESVTYISDLNATYPTGSDPKSEGDNHIRNIKAGIKATFLNIDGPVTSTEDELNILDGATTTVGEINYLDITTLGTGAASKALVLDAGEDYTWPATGILTYGVLKDPAATTITATGAEINYNDIASLGTGAASKSVVLDAGEDFVWPTTGVLTLGVVKDVAATTLTTTFAELNQLDGIPGTLTATELGYVDGVTSAIQTQMDLKAPLASPALTGTPTAPTATVTDDSTQIATTAFVNDVVIAATVPTQTGNAGKFLQTDGSNTSWAASTALVTPEAASATFTADVSDVGKFFMLTGTYTVDFDDAATLGAGWYAYFRNEDTGTITLDPSGSQTIGGQTTLTLAQGTVLVFSDGSNLFFQAQGRGVYTRELKTSGTSWTAPQGVYWVKLTLVGGGGGGGDYGGAATNGSTGGGGACVIDWQAVDPGDSYTYAIGAAGTAGDEGGTADGGAGGDTTWATGTLSAGGGGGGDGDAATSAGGAGGTASGTGAWLIDGGRGEGGAGGRYSNKAGDSCLGFGGTGSAAGTGYGAGGCSGDNGSTACAGTQGALYIEYEL